MYKKKFILKCCKAKLYKGEKCKCEKKNKPKGSLCSINGNNYEKKIYKIIKNCNINGIKFNTQQEETLGGSSSLIDLECNFINDKDIGIEVKKCNTPDWMQCSIKYNSNIKKWEATKKCKIPTKSRELFNNIINNINIFNGKVPPFIEKNITHEEWILLKKSTNNWNDQYINIPNDTIKKMYNFKNCQYIQISDYGLYHLGNDICEFNVPEFIIEQKLRIRTKIHSKKNKKGFCNLSVTISCYPKNIKSLYKSPYSLDTIDKLPKNIIYNN